MRVGIMRLLGVTAAVCLLVCALPSVVAARDNSLAPGAWSMQFRISENFQIADFYGLSVKRNFSSRDAVRLALDMSVNSSSSSGPSTNDLDRQFFESEALYVRNHDPQSEVIFFYGAGPYGGVNRTESTGVSGSGLQEIRQKDRSWFAGIRLVAGIEWFATRAISLHGEYRGRMTYNYTSNERVMIQDGDEVNRVESNNKRWNFGGVGSVLFGISAYF